jgi:hypothetical protein
MSWILHLRQFLIEINASREIHNLWLPKPQRENRRFLMTAFTNMKATRAELVILNNWRIYYKVILLLEICFASGKGIQTCFMEVNHSSIIDQSLSSLTWPVQGKQDETSFKIWKQFLKQCFINPDNQQIPAMGQWDIKEVLQTTPRHGYYSATKKEIYIKTGSTFTNYDAYDIGITSARYNPSQPLPTIPKIPTTSILVDLYEYSKSTLAKFDMTHNR